MRVDADTMAVSNVEGVVGVAEVELVGEAASSVGVIVGDFRVTRLVNDGVHCDGCAAVKHGEDDIYW